MSASPEARRASVVGEPEPRGLPAKIREAIVLAAVRQQHAGHRGRVLSRLVAFVHDLLGGEAIDPDTAETCLMWLAQAIVDTECDGCGSAMDRPVCPLCRRSRP